MRTGFRLLALAMLLPVCALAQQFPIPGKPVTIIEGFPNGSGVDIYARMIADRLSPALGVPVVVDNRIGAGGNLSMEYVSKQAPDGHTILFVTSAMLAINPALYARMPVDPQKALAPLMVLADVPNVLTVSTEKRPQFDTCPKVIAAAKVEPGKLNYASTGNGASTHLAGAQFAMAAGIDLVHVPYRGGPFAMTALLAGDVDIFFYQTAPVIGAWQQGQVRLLGVTSAGPVGALPGVPTIAEACNLPGFVSTTWYGLSLPVGVPQPIVDRLYREISTIVLAPDFNKRILDQALTPMVEGPEQMRARTERDLVHWAEIVRKSGARVE